MAEIYVNTSTPATTKIYVKGEAVTPSSPVTVKVYDITGDPVISPPINPTSILTTLTAEQSEVDIGSYNVYLPLSYTARRRKFKLVWEWQYEGASYSNTTMLDIVTPYVDIQEAAQEMGLGSDSNDPNHRTYQELKLAERYARNIIDGYTGQKFFLHDDYFSSVGNDSDTMHLTKKVNRLHTLHANDQLLVDNLNEVNNLGLTIDITTSGFGIKVNMASILDNDVYIANGMVPPSIHDSSPDIFRRSKNYKVYARFGWEYVPNEVRDAAVEIMKMYFAKDRVWKDRYVKKVSTTDWDFEYSSEAFSGTGSSYADKLLADYVITQMVLV
jgi:hypothetical protein